MKIVLLFFVTILLGCNQATEKKTTPAEQTTVLVEETTTPVEQTTVAVGHPVPGARLYQLADQAVDELSAATNETMVNEISEKYRALIHSYLADSCQSVLNSQAVKVERIEPYEGTIYTSFSKGAVHFYSSLSSREGEAPANEVVRFAGSLPENSEKVLNFIYLGECEVGFFKDQVEITIKAAAAPPGLNPDKAVIDQLIENQ